MSNLLKLSNNLYYKATLLQVERKEKVESFQNIQKYTANYVNKDDKSYSYKNIAVTIKLQKDFYQFIRKELSQNMQEIVLTKINEAIGGLNNFRHKNDNISLDEDELMGFLEKIFEDTIQHYETESIETNDIDKSLELLLSFKPIKTKKSDLIFKLKENI